MTSQISPLLCPLYREVARACIKTFGADVEASYRVRQEIKQLVRENPQNISVEILQQQLVDAKEFITFNIVQAQMNSSTGNYRVKITDDHVKKGNVIDLRTYDPEKDNNLPWMRDK